jgi:hypothetical protein
MSTLSRPPNKNSTRSHSRLRILIACVLAVFAYRLALGQCCRSNQEWIAFKRSCGLNMGLAYNDWLRQGAPCPARSAGTNDNGAAQRAAEAAAEQRRLDLQREREEAERKEKAGKADQSGQDAAARGDWKAAADNFMEALEYAPGSADIRARLDRANTALADQGTAADIVALRQRIQDSITAANLDAFRERLEDEDRAQRLNQMYDNMLNQREAVPAVRITNDRLLVYPVLLHPVPANSAPAKVLTQYQPKIKAVDDEIHEAQEVLRRLIESNSRNEELREEWVKESEEATVDAQDLSLSLLLDLIGAHVDHLAETNKEERNTVLQHLLDRTGENGKQNSIHSAYGALVNRKEELDRIQSELGLAGKENDLRVEIREFDMEKGKKPTLENLWTVVNSFKKVEEMAGPSKDLLDATYTIFQQAASFYNLGKVRDNDEKTLQAAASLQQYIRRLEAKKKAEKSEIAH